MNYSYKVYHPINFNIINYIRVYTQKGSINLAYAAFISGLALDEWSEVSYYVVYNFQNQKYC